MTALNKQALLIENGQLVADTLRHLADNEIDSDYFAITSTSENGTEIEHELVITDYALQAAGTVDELTRALEAAQKYAKGRDAENEDLMLTVGRLRMEKEAAEKRIAELEARTVTLPTPYPKGYGLVSDKYNFALEECADAIRAAGIGVKGE